MEHNSVLQSLHSLSFRQKVKKAFLSFSLLGKISFFLIFACFFVSGGFFAYLFNDSFKVDVPERGGVLKEGIIGLPQEVSPLTAKNQTDKDLSALIFSGLVRQKEDATFVPDLALSYSLSADGKTYDFILNDNIFFHDGGKLTADDVVYTFEQAQRSNTNPYLAAAWQYVIVEKISDKEVKITLPKASASFFNNFTLGILPRSKAEVFPPVANESGSAYTIPVGSGPYKVKNIKTAIDGTPQYYEFSAFRDESGKIPYINTLIMRFYSNERELLNGFRNNEIDSASGISLDTAKILQGTHSTLQGIPTDRVFGVFFNQKKGLNDIVVRQALNIAIDRGELVSTIFGGIGYPLYLPAPTSLLQPSSTTLVKLETWNEINGQRLTDAIAILHQAGWNENEQGVMEKQSKGQEPVTLTFSLNVPNVSSLVSTAQYLKDVWAKIGVNMTIEISDSATFSQNILANKNYEAVLFGQEIGNPINFRPFWHSATTSTSTISANAALYSNKKIDTLIDQSETATTSQDRLMALQNIEDTLAEELPAIFLYQPAYPYILPKNVISPSVNIAMSPEQRFASVRDWHIETERVWKIFTQNE